MFLRKSKDLDEYRKDFDRVKEAIEKGKTPVQNEMRLAKTILFEAIPYQILSGFFLVLGTLLLNKIGINEILKIAVVLVINNVCYATANYLFTIVKHRLRIALCRRLAIEPTERNIAVMESMEYQSV